MFELKIESRKTQVSFIANFSLEKITQQLESKGYSDRQINANIHKYFFIVNYIYNKEFYLKDTDTVSLSSIVIKEYLGNDYKRIMDNLRSWNYVYTSNYYREGQCRTYVVTNKNIGKYTFNWNTSQFINKIITEKKSKNYKLIQTHNRQLQRITKTLKSLQWDHIDTNTLTLEEYLSLDRLINDLFCVEGITGKRIYNNFTNLPRKLRSLLRFNDQPLISFDLVNSQPIFLMQLVKDKIKNTTIATDRLIDKTAEGKFYEYFSSLIGIQLNNNNRDAFKKMFYQFLYGKSLTCKFSMALKNNHLEVYNVIEKFKQSKVSLASKLQKMEAEIIFEVVNKLDIPLLTVHDSLYFPSEHYTAVKNKLVSVLKSRKIDCLLKDSNDKIIVVENKTSIDYNNYIINHPTVQINNRIIN